MEAQTDIQTYLERGRLALSQGQPREAAIAYAHGAQMEPNNPQVHLGLAEANLALNNYGVTQMACRRVQELEPTSGIEAMTAQALLDLLDRRYERALQTVDSIVEEEPGIAYIHALRSYLLRATGQDYDANLARARAARLSFGGRFENCFPPLEPIKLESYKAAPTTPLAEPEQRQEQQQVRSERETVPTWSRPGRMQRRVIRTRFYASQHPGLVTYIILGICLIFFIGALLVPDLIDPFVQVNGYVAQGQVWRLLTTIFIQDPSNILSTALSLLILYFIGRQIEVLFGKIRYLLIFLGSGVIANLLFFFTSSPVAATAGVSACVIGSIGALLAFYVANRNMLGASGMLQGWIFWIVLSLVLNFVTGTFLWYITGLLTGFVIGYLLIPRTRGSRLF